MRNRLCCGTKIKLCCEDSSKPQTPQTAIGIKGTHQSCGKDSCSFCETTMQTISSWSKAFQEPMTILNSDNYKYAASIPMRTFSSASTFMNEDARARRLLAFVPSFGRKVDPMDDAVPKTWRKDLQFSRSAPEVESARARENRWSDEYSDPAPTPSPNRSHSPSGRRSALKAAIGDRPGSGPRHVSFGGESSRCYGGDSS